MRLLSKFNHKTNSLDFSHNNHNIVHFGRFEAIKNGVNTVKQGASKLIGQGAKAAATAGDDVADVAQATQQQLSPQHIAALTSLAEDARTYRQGKWGKAGVIANVGMMAGTPLMLAPLFMEDANTKAVKAMRAEDKKRELMGLKPLAATPQMIAEDAAKAASSAFSYSQDNTRVINMTPKYILPGELPSGSLR